MRKVFAIMSFFLLTIAVSAVHAQGTNPPLFRERNGDDIPPKSVRESLDRMRIEHEKKEYAEMLKRSEDAARIANEIEDLYSLTGRFSNEDVAKLSEVEKLVKKIRSELGGSDDDGGDDTADISQPTTSSDAVASLNRNAASLHSDLKRTSRFTISATAIQSTNIILRVTRFLKGVN
ncbi:MAG: hypothetical protein IPM59_10955 [Chloracidobacterium sp.]|nr:hypothetical protein [Chloracidobacterium sp.]